MTGPRLVALVAVLSLAACGGGSSPAVTSTIRPSTTTTTSTTTTSTTVPTLDSLRDEAKAETTADAKDCLTRDYDRNCYGQVAAGYQADRLIYTETADADPRWRDAEYVTCVGNAFASGLSDADLRSWVTVLAGETTVGRELLAEIYGAGFRAFNVCDRDS